MTTSALNVQTFFISDPVISLTNKSDLLHFLHSVCALSATNEYRHTVFLLFLIVSLQLFSVLVTRPNYASS